MSAESLATRLNWNIRLATSAPVEAFLPHSRRLFRRSAHRRLHEAVEHTYRSVPHYREVFEDRGLTPADIREPADLAGLPILEREELQADPERFISDRVPRQDLVRLRTGGSSGEPLAVYHDPRGLFEATAYRERRRGIYLRAAGKRLRLRRTSFGTDRGTGATLAREFRTRNLIPRGIRVQSESHSMHASAEENVRHIERFKPDLVAGYGSYIELLMDHVEDRGGISHVPPVIVYGGDAMSERSRLAITRRFGIDVYSAYGSVEAFQLGFDCEEHRGLHMNVDLYPVRLVDRGGREVPMGSSGEVVVSSLVHRGTVLLNYRLGDVARWIPEPCPCGRVLPLMSYVEGRFDDWLELPGGGLLHPQALRELFTPEDEIVRSYQVEQRSPSDYRLSVVPAPAASEARRRELAGRLSEGVRGRTADGVRVQVDFVEELPRTARGKVRTILSAESRRRARPASDIEIRPARGDELDAILAVMEPANMHRVDSPEMPRLDVDRFFVAELEGEVVGAAGWELLEPGLAKTTLLSVLPRARGRGLGNALQTSRMEAMARAGARRVRTNADRPETIAWYKREFGYEEVGRLPKEDEFGDPSIDEWTTIEAPLPRSTAG